MAMAAFKVSREYAKKWFTKMLTVALTLAFVTGMLGFVLDMQGTFSGKLCSVVSQLESQMKQTITKTGGDLDAETVVRLKEIRENVQKRLSNLHILAASWDNLSPTSPNQQLVSNIQKGCNTGMQSGNTDSTNILFVAMQYLVVCMLFNRLIIESANLASAIVGSTGINTNGSQEVSGGVGGMQRGGMASKGVQGNGKNPM